MKGKRKMDEMKKMQDEIVLAKENEDLTFAMPEKEAATEKAEITEEVRLEESQKKITQVSEIPSFGRKTVRCTVCRTAMSRLCFLPSRCMYTMKRPTPLQRWTILLQWMRKTDILYAAGIALWQDSAVRKQMTSCSRLKRACVRLPYPQRRTAKKRDTALYLCFRKPLLPKMRLQILLVFDSAIANADMEYRVTGNGVKEDIIVKEKADVYRYPFTISMENITADFKEDEQCVSFKSMETEEEVFYIPAPFMQDANGVVSTGVFYEVKEIADGAMQLTVIADSEWMNAEDRAFPVVIDPQVIVPGSSSMTTYSWNNGRLYTAQSIPSAQTAPVTAPAMPTVCI